jgi:phage replication O-like protein O
MKNPWKQYSKINPQRENGNRQIANDVFQALMSAELSGSEFRIVMAVINNTWGYGKESDCIAISRFIEMTNLAERTIKKAIKTLKEARVLICAPSNIRVHHGSPMNEFLFNKHYDTWKTQGCKNVHACTKVSSKGAQKCQVRVNDRAPTKESITKENITKEKTNRSNDFDRFWSSYPKKVGKQAAMRAYKAHIKKMPPINILVEIISRQKQTDQWQRGYIPNPATWINQGRWDDDISSMNGGNEHGSSRVYAGQRQNVPTTRQMEIDAETERLAQEYYRLKENSAASNP